LERASSGAAEVLFRPVLPAAVRFHFYHAILFDGTQTGKAIPFTEEVPPFVPTPVDNLGLLPI